MSANGYLGGLTKPYNGAPTISRGVGFLLRETFEKVCQAFLKIPTFPFGIIISATILSFSFPLLTSSSGKTI